MRYRVALAGNPNCGKTTLFNALTGSNQYVGNWAGVTVEKKSGFFDCGDDEIELIDLPGIYSLSPYTMEEVITRDYIADEHPDVVLNIIDGTNMERNMYLTLQLMELGLPMVIAVNMIDDLEAMGDVCNCSDMAHEMGVAVVPISAKKETGIDQLINALLQAAKNKSHAGAVRYDDHTNKAIKEIKRLLINLPQHDQYHINFYAAKLLEGDQGAERKLKLSSEVLQKINEIATNYEKNSSYGDRETMLADARYQCITVIVGKYLIKKPKTEELTLSDKIDKIVTNRFLAIPIFFAVMLVMFLLAFGPLGEAAKSGIEYLLNGLFAPWLSATLQAAGAPLWTQSLLVEGVITGVGSVLSFLPQLVILFLFLSLLEDSGYMARAAFVMDGFLRKIGLNGKAFIPMLMGFGCSVPAIMAARTMESEKDRKLTIMLVPFMSCGARMPIYALFAGAFFTKNRGLVVFSIYMLGIAVAIITGLFLKRSLFKKSQSPFIMELPTYRLPGLKTMARHTWDKCKDFLVRAATLIFSMTVIVWLLQHFTPTFVMTQAPETSILGRLGGVIAPLLVPLGFGTWQAAVALMSGFIAKEAVVSSMSVLYGAVGTGSLSAILVSQTGFNPVSAYAFMTFTLLYMPCIAAFSAMRRELNSWKWTLGTVFMQTGLAYLAALIINQVGSLLFG